MASLQKPFKSKIKLKFPLQCLELDPESITEAQANAVDRSNQDLHILYIYIILYYIFIYIKCISHFTVVDNYVQSAEFNEKEKLDQL